jgi:hypothetical protein
VKTLRPSEMAPDPNRLVCRQGILATTVGGVVLIAVIAGSGFLWRYFHAPGFVWMGCIGLAALFVPFILSGIGPLYRKSNWGFAVDRDCVWINLRSYRNAHLPEAPTVVRINFDEIQSASLCYESYTVPGGGSGSTGTSMNGKFDCLQLKSSRDHTDALTEALKQEFGRPGASRRFLGFVTVTSKAMGSLVSVPEPGTIRILWRGGQGIYMMPSASDVIEMLADKVRIDDSVEKDYTDWCDIEGAELKHLIRDLALSGDTISAVRLLSRRTGLTLTAANNEVKTIGP